MTIKRLVNAMNAHPEIWVKILNCHQDAILYSGHYDRLTGKMLDWEVESFDIETFSVTDYGRRFVTTLRIVLEYGAELH